MMFMDGLGLDAPGHPAKGGSECVGDDSLECTAHGMALCLPFIDMLTVIALLPAIKLFMPDNHLPTRQDKHTARSSAFYSSHLGGHFGSHH